jgi:very-short-patch-repair endonuclease
MGFNLNDLPPEHRREAERQLRSRRHREPKAKPTAAAKLLPADYGKKQGDKDKLVNLFRQKWLYLKGPAMVAEHPFAKDAKPKRNFRFDFAHLDAKVAVEIHGGVWTRGRHTRGHGFIADRTKTNLAQAMGWLVFELTGSHLQNSENLERIIQAIHGRLMGQGE